ncbi:general secretion pathway protein GspE [Geomonas sp. Red69]|uniref:General secretion pathway protein GspE n=1 Tax=Geomonas diazotrophica TaxID=2843197 RepID=A0ABX8JKP8_9BACT|nr:MULTISPECIES: general secretion pathway protein GspE [Geomonas]MBU5638505.1 general secretion pathway protein GspE [Geomonas diazotrophica]QWV97227.1 general secretion pathway protein GspE [Geomonas nitrogeniifigens]QXE86398.1 general secretion pathway protein GspE [Geomonas nitrogeniifigens]
MSAKLGEMLLKVGALSKTQLDQVLQAQVIYGGRLGTNLVEMGLVSEDELAHVLSEQMGAPCVEPAELSSVPDQVLRLVPIELIRRYRVIPIAVEGKRLSLAMANPHDFKALEEIGFVTGMVIKPRICPELRLNVALERFYRITRPTRFIKVEGGLRTSFEAGSRPPAPTMAPLDNRWDTAPVGEPVFSDQLSVRELAEMMAAAASEKEVVQALVSYISGEFDRGGFLRLKSGKATGVQAVADGLPVESFAGFEVEVGNMAHLQRMTEEKGVVLCEFAVGDAEGALVRAMGGKLPASALLLPVSLGGHVVGVICASDGKGRLGGGAFELQRVGVMAELSLEMLSLRRKIKSA